mmetsp:Transcript_26985/g.75282  ORF Transcript_26985/g.75282 Transcript_26985/m.75282 type:complete len:370 (-) Transcript_26985:178-1287(-)
MACSTTACLPWHRVPGVEHSSKPAATSMALAPRRGTCPAPASSPILELSEAFSGSMKDVFEVSVASVPETREADARSANVALHLQLVLRRLQPATQDEGQLLLQLLDADVPARLVSCLGALEFEARKDAMWVFHAILQLTGLLGDDVGRRVVDNVQNRPQIQASLLEGAGRPELFWHCAQTLQSCAHHPALVEALLKAGAAARLLELARLPNFEVASEAFASLRALLLSHKEISAAYLEANFAVFFGTYTALLCGADYVTQRQALSLLGEILLDRTFVDVMCVYVGKERSLRVVMNLLRDKSLAVQTDAFHVFKIFVANPHKPRRVQRILYQNKDRIVKLLEAFRASKQDDDACANDACAIIGMLHDLY